MACDDPEKLCYPTGEVTRRAFLGRATAAGAGAVALSPKASAQRRHFIERAGGSTYVDLLRVPDRVTAYCGLGDTFSLSRQAARWTGPSVEVETVAAGGEVVIRLTAPKEALTHVQLRWTLAVAPSLLFLGDAWERTYGDAAWRSMVPERPMPWYFATWDGAALHGYGVKTGARAMCFWQADAEGVSLWLDVSNGGSGVLLGQRVLAAAAVVTYQGQSGDGTPSQTIAAAREFCKRMCQKPRPSPGAIYGSNDWYYAYGNSSQEAILRDADLVASLRPASGPKPFTVIDEGWAHPKKFPDMGKLAEEIKQRGVRPGIWERPLRAPTGTNPGLLMTAGRFGEKSKRSEELAYDPTVPEGLHAVTEKVRAIRGWGFALLKHDFTSYDFLGQWGYEMGPQPTLPGWCPHDRSRTNAEILLDLYQAIRTAAGEEMLILSCNVVGHLGAGIFDIQRTGDDTSGKIWERTRRTGVNSLAFRLPQHGAFFALDADCVAITAQVPWSVTREWLEVVAGSGTALIISAAPEATGEEQKRAIREAFATVTSRAAAVPENWFESTTPEVWVDELTRAIRRYQWCAPNGAYPFGI